MTLFPVNLKPGSRLLVELDADWSVVQSCIGVECGEVLMYSDGSGFGFYSEKTFVEEAMNIAAEEESSVLMVFADFGVSIEMCRFKDRAVLRTCEGTYRGELLNQAFAKLSLAKSCSDRAEDVSTMQPCVASLEGTADTVAFLAEHEGELGHVHVPKRELRLGLHRKRPTLLGGDMPLHFDPPCRIVGTTVRDELFLSVRLVSLPETLGAAVLELPCLARTDIGFLA